MAAPFPDVLPDDCWGEIIDAPKAGLSPADLASLASASKTCAALVARVHPSRLGVRVFGTLLHPNPPPCMTWVLARPCLASLTALALDVRVLHFLSSLGAYLRPGDAAPRLRDLALFFSGDGPLTPRAVPAADILPRTGRVTRLALHGARLSTAGLAGTPAGAGLRALELDTAHAGPLWRPMYTMSVARGVEPAPEEPPDQRSPARLCDLALATATPGLASLSIRCDSDFDVFGDGLVPVAPPAGAAADEEQQASAARLASALALPAQSLTFLSLLVSAPQAAPLAAAVAAMVRGLPRLARLDITNRLGGVPSARELMQAAAARESRDPAGPPPLALRLSGARSPFDPLSGDHLGMPFPSPGLTSARLVSLSLGSGRPMSAGGFGVGPGDGDGAGAATLDLFPLAEPGAAPFLEDLEVRDYGALVGLSFLAAAEAKGLSAGLTRLALRVNRRFSREGAAVRVAWPVGDDDGGDDTSFTPRPFARLRRLEVSLGEAHPDWALVAWAGPPAARGGALPPVDSVRPGTPAHADLMREAGCRLGRGLDDVCFVSAGARAADGAVADPFEDGVLTALGSRARAVSVPDSARAAPASPGTAAWAAPHPAMRLSFTDAALVPGGVGCAAAGLPASVVSAVWGRGGSGGEQAAFHELSAGRGGRA